MTSARTDDKTAALLQASEHALRRNDRETALRLAREAFAAAPDQPDVLRQLAAALSAFGASPHALMHIDRAVVLRPDDAALLSTRGVVLEVNGQRDAALAAFRRASELAPHSAALAYNLGRALSKFGQGDDALRALERAIAIDPAHRAARATRAAVFRQLGKTADAIAAYRELIAADPTDVNVFSALAALSADALTDAEVAALERLQARADLDIEARVRIGFALGRVYERRARYPQAFAAYTHANAAVRSQLPWNNAAFSAQVTSILGAFPAAIERRGETQGNDVVFIVSLPRSGSTLTEQILAAHSQVDAGDERTDLFDVIADEGRRRQMPLSRWAPLATADDWRRLGESYLQRSTSVRTGRALATDKMPSNWLWLGVAMAMLPGARVIEARRNILETAWSCFSHLFNGGAQEFSYDIASIAAYARDCDRAMTHWRMLYPTRIRTQVYEKIVVDIEAQVRELLDFCGLAFEPACLRFYEAQRGVRTASASQVREPLRSDTARTAHYGALLDPMRTALGLPLFQG